MANKKDLTCDEVQVIVEEVLSDCEERGVTVKGVEPSGDCFSVLLNGDMSISGINAIAEKFSDPYMIVSAEEYGYLSLFLKPRNEDSDDNSCSPKEEYEPHMELHHQDQYGDCEDAVIPGTTTRVSNTEQNEQIKAWMKETGRIPLSYVRLEDGIHCELSDAFERKIKATLEEGRAIGNDGRKYTFEDFDKIFPVCGSICVRATCIDNGRSDVYSLDFFA